MRCAPFLTVRYVTVLLLVLACAVPVARADTGPNAVVAAEVDRLYAQASRAAERHEAARRAAGIQRVAAVRAARAAEAERLRLVQLRAAMGGEARAQYRTGGVPPTVQLLLVSHPDGFLDAVARARGAQRAVTGLGRHVTESVVRLEREERAAVTALGERRRQLAVQAAARRTVTRKLERARAKLRQLAALRSAKAGLPAGGCAYVPAGGTAESASARGARGSWTAPVGGSSVGAGFGLSGKHWQHRHTGQDFVVPTATPVRAVGGGVVVAAGCGDAFGNQIVLRHPGGYYTQYAHLSARHVCSGDRVRTGQRIGLSGATGNVSGPHLHFEVRLTPHLGSGIDPLPWLRERGVQL